MVRHTKDVSSQIEKDRKIPTQPESMPNSPNNVVSGLNINVPELFLPSGSESDSETDEGNLSNRNDSSFEKNSPLQKIDSKKNEKIQVQSESLFTKVTNFVFNSSPTASPKNSKTTIIDPDAEQKASILKNLKEDLKTQINQTIRAINREKDKISQGKLSSANLLKLPKFNEIEKYKQNLKKLVDDLKLAQAKLSDAKNKSFNEVGNLSVEIGTLNQEAINLLNQFTELNNIAEQAVDKLRQLLIEKLKASEVLFDNEKYNKLMIPLTYWGQKDSKFCSSIGNYIEKNIRGDESNKNAVVSVLIELHRNKLANYNASKLIEDSKNSLNYFENLKNWDKRDNLLSVEKMEKCFEDEKKLDAKANSTLKELTEQLAQLEDKNLSKKLQTLVTGLINSLLVTNSKIREENELALNNAIVEWKKELNLKIESLKIIIPELNLTVEEKGASISSDILTCCKLEEQLGENFKQYQVSVHAKLNNLQKIEPLKAELLYNEFKKESEEELVSAALTQKNIQQWSVFEQKIETAAAQWFQRLTDAISNIINESAKKEFNVILGDTNAKSFLLSKDDYTEKSDKIRSAVEKWQKVINRNFAKMNEKAILVPNELKKKSMLALAANDFLKKISLLNEIEQTQIKMLEKNETLEKLTKQKYDDACKRLDKLKNELLQLKKDSQQSIDLLPRILENKSALKWTQKIVTFHEEASQEAYKIYEKNNAKLIEIKEELASLTDILATNEEYQQVLKDVDEDPLQQKKLSKWQAQYNAFKINAIKQDGSENPLFADGTDLQVDRYRGLRALKNTINEQLKNMTSLPISVRSNNIEDLANQIKGLIDQKLKSYTNEGQSITFQDMIQVGHQTKRLWVAVRNVAYLSNKKELFSEQQRGWFEFFANELWTWLSTFGGLLKKTTTTERLRKSRDQIDNKFKAFSNQFFADSLVAKLVAKFDGEEILELQQIDQLVDGLIEELKQSPMAIKDFLLNVSGKHSFLLILEMSTLKERYNDEKNKERKDLCDKLETAIKEKGTVSDLLMALEMLDFSDKKQIRCFAEYASKVLVDRMTAQEMQQQLSIYSGINEILLSKLKKVCDSIGLIEGYSPTDNESHKDILTWVLSSEKEELKTLLDNDADEKLVREKENTIETLEKQIKTISEDTVSTELYRLRKIKDLKLAVENEVHQRKNIGAAQSTSFISSSADSEKEEIADGLFTIAKKTENAVDQQTLYLLQQRLRYQTNGEFTAETCDLLIQAQTILKKNSGNFLYRSIFENPNAKLVQKIDDYMQKGYAEIAARPSV